jgi:hypothetical protein
LSLEFKPKALKLLNCMGLNNGAPGSLKSLPIILSNMILAIGKDTLVYMPNTK